MHSWVIISILATSALAEDRLSAFRAAVCSRGYSLDCFKLDLVGLIGRTGGGGSYQLLPGIFFSHNMSAVPPTEELVQAIKAGHNDTHKKLESYISSTINDYLSSLTLSLKVLDTNTVSHARRISEQILTSVMPLETGRKKGYGFGGALWAAGTLAAVGLAALAAISGKAMMASMLALMMAGTSVMRNGNGNGNGNGGCKSTHYIDAHARAMELERLAAVDEPVEIHSQASPIYNRPQDETLVYHQK